MLKKGKRILLISNMYPSKKYPHYGIFVKNCETILLNGGYSVRRICMVKQKYLWMKAFSYMFFYIKSILIGLLGKYDCVYVHYASHMMVIVQMLKKFRPNIIVVTNVHGNDIVPIGQSDMKNPVRSWETLQLSDYVIAPSEYFVNILLNEYGVNKKKIFCSPSGGVNTKVFYHKNKRECRKKLFVDEDIVLVGFVSRLEEGKEWKTFLASMKLLRQKGVNVCYMIIGEGSQSQECREMIMQNDMESYGFLNKLMTQEELSDYYNTFDVFAFPSIQESLGLVGLEAMACGVPCVVSRIPGIMTYAKDRLNCRMFIPGDCVGLCVAIEDTLYMSIEEKTEQIKQGSMTANEYDSEYITKNFLDIFSKICP